ncbi:11037_t:CDS:2, partial [Gigaspora rosea]
EAPVASTSGTSETSEPPETVNKKPEASKLPESIEPISEVLDTSPKKTDLSSLSMKTVLNILTGRWIDPNGRLFRKLIHEGYKYTDRLSDYLEDNGTMWIDEFELDPLLDFYHPALIPPLSILANRSDICKKFPITVESVVEGGVSLFTLEKNKRSSLQNLIEMKYSSDNLSTLIGIIWEHKETKVWRNDILTKFLHYPTLTPSKYRPAMEPPFQGYIFSFILSTRKFQIDVNILLARAGGP